MTIAKNSVRELEPLQKVDKSCGYYTVSTNKDVIMANLVYHSGYFPIVPGSESLFMSSN